MAKAEFERIEDLKAKVGGEVYVSDWVEITQERVNKFAEASDDHQWIHVDVERARKESAFGGTIAHGFLTLSLLAKFNTEGYSLRERKTGINYGLNKVRFTTPVKVGARIRCRAKLAQYEEIPGGAQLTWSMTIELEGSERPACVAESISRAYR